MQLFRRTAKAPNDLLESRHETYRTRIDSTNLARRDEDTIADDGRVYLAADQGFGRVGKFIRRKMGE